MSDDRSFADRNARSQHRLQELVARLSPDELLIELEGGWTVAATLAHLAFWDRWALARWTLYDREGRIPDLPDGIADLANAATVAEWRALPADAAVELVLAAAAVIDAKIEALPVEAIAHAVETNRPGLVDRSVHRGAHLDDIESFLASR